VNLRPSSFVNIGKHLNDTPGPSSTQKPLQTNDSNYSTNYPNNAGTTGIATNLFPNNDDPTDYHHIEPSSIGSVCNALWFGSIALILAFLYSESEDAFVIDGSVEEEPLALDEDSTSKLTYFLSRYGTHNINISGSSSASSQHQEELFDGLTDENGGSFWLVRFLPAILPVLSYGILFLCACLLLQIATKRSREIVCSSISKEQKLLSTPLASATKRCTKELHSLEKGSVVSSTFKHEIVRNDGSKTKVRRSSRIVLSSPKAKISQTNAKLESCSEAKVHENVKLEPCSEVVVNLMDEFS